MTTKILTLFFFASVLLISCTPKALYRTAWQSTPVTVDGNASEWRIPLRFYDPDTKLNYTLSNDNEKIYLCIRIVDELSQAKVMRNGLNIWFDTLAKKNKHCGILFPVPDKAGEENGENNLQGGSHHSGGRHGSGGNSEDIKERFLRQANQMQLIGFKKNIPDYLTTENEFGINVNINWDANNIMIYEASIPFGAFYKPKLEPRDSLKNFDFAMTIHGFTAPKKDDSNTTSSGNNMGGSSMGSMNGAGMGGGMNGMGGMNGSGMTGGRPNGMRGNMAEADPRFETNSFWARINFSVK